MENSSVAMPIDLFIRRRAVERKIGRCEVVVAGCAGSGAGQETPGRLPQKAHELLGRRADAVSGDHVVDEGSPPAAIGVSRRRIVNNIGVGSEAIRRVACRAGRPTS